MDAYQVAFEEIESGRSRCSYQLVAANSLEDVYRYANKLLDTWFGDGKETSPGEGAWVVNLDRTRVARIDCVRNAHTLPITVTSGGTIMGFVILNGH